MQAYFCEHTIYDFTAVWVGGTPALANKPALAITLKQHPPGTFKERR